MGLWKNSDSKQTRNFYKQGIKISAMMAVWNSWSFGESSQESDDQGSEETIEKGPSIEEIRNGEGRREIKPSPNFMSGKKFQTENLIPNQV